MNTIHAVTFLARLLGPLLVLLAPISALHAQVPHAGKWSAREVNLVRLSPTCAYVDSVDATYDLSPGMNKTAAGTLVRAWRRTLWTSDLHCRLPGVAGTKSFTLRFDNWSVNGQYESPDLQKLSAFYTGCNGDCESEAASPRTFTMPLRYQAGALTGEVVAGISNAVKYSPAQDFDQVQASASAAFWPLYRPLVDGNCNEFVRESLDASTRNKLNPMFCEFGRGLSKVMPTVLSTQPMYEFAASLGMVPGINGPVILSYGDVLICRLVVVDGKGGGVFSGAVMRKQADGAWKIADLVLY